MTNETHLPETDKTILLVDDEPITLWAIGEALEAGGHQVFIAHDGREALALYSQHQNKIDLLITDLQMRDMDGTDLISAIRADNVSLPMLIISGYFGSRLEKLVGQPGIYLLQKPFGLAKLLEVVQEIFEDEAG